MKKEIKERLEKGVNYKEIDLFIKDYLDNLPDGWTTQLDMMIAMKNSMIVALSYPDKFTKGND
jgi:hypothetical protein